MTATSPDLSIVIVNWNTREMLQECLASVTASAAGQAAEVIVIDNASSDGSADMVADQFAQVHLVRNAENTGFAAANNQGFEIAHGRHVLLLNSDTVVHGEVLARSVAYLDAHPSVGAMGCRVLNTDGTVQMTCSLFPTLTNLALETSGLWKLSKPAFLGRYHMTGWQRDSERPVEVISGCYLLVRAEIIRDVGPLDDSFFFYGEETDWCRRIADAGWTLMFAPVGEITHHGGGSVAKLNHRKDVLLTEAMVHLHRKHGGWPAAAMCWSMLLAFNASRVAYWSTLYLLRRRPAARARAEHFLKVVRDSRQAWKVYG